MLGQWSVYIRTFRRRIDFPGGKLTCLVSWRHSLRRGPTSLWRTVHRDSLRRASDRSGFSADAPFAGAASATDAAGWNPRGRRHASSRRARRQSELGGRNNRSAALSFFRHGVDCSKSPWRLPWSAPHHRSTEALRPPFEDSAGSHPYGARGPGSHCDSRSLRRPHCALRPREKVLIAGDAFMGSYFATPNPDVDSLQVDRYTRAPADPRHRRAGRRAWTRAHLASGFSGNPGSRDPRRSAR